MTAPVTCTRRLTFCAGHRVVGHENKCNNIHGHNYVVEITAQAEYLDSIGRVIDFSVLKEKVGGWLDANWDHGFIVWTDDADVSQMLHAFNSMTKRPTKVYFVRDTPTAENMAHFLLTTVCPLVLQGTSVTVTHVRLYETENCWADASL